MHGWGRCIDVLIKRHLKQLLFVLFILVIVLVSVLQFTASGYSFGIFKPFSQCNEQFY